MQALHVHHYGKQKLLHFPSHKQQISSISYIQPQLKSNTPFDPV